ncbi:MAG TPA: HAD family hydrolase [Gemmataceae bacterium]|jgi:HAD superfamily hydrolase (TIGR01509 family)
MPQPKTNNVSQSQQGTAPEGEHDSRLAFLFDLDGTLVDSVYRQVQAWQEAFLKKDLPLPAWRIHRRIGMSGGMLVRALLRESGRRMSEEEMKQIEDLHGETYGRLVADVKLLPGARELLEELSRLKRPWAIVTSSKPEKAEHALKMLGVGPDANVVTRAEVSRAKPEPDPYYVGAQRLNMSIRDCVVVGDSVWDLLSAQRARALGVGFLTGGSGRDELERAGAYRVYEDPADLLRHLDELGVNTE